MWSGMFLRGTWHHVPGQHLPCCVSEATLHLNDGNMRRDTINRMEDPASNMKGRRTRFREPLGKKGARGSAGGERCRRMMAVNGGGVAVFPTVNAFGCRTRVAGCLFQIGVELRMLWGDVSRRD